MRAGTHNGLVGCSLGNGGCWDMIEGIDGWWDVAVGCSCEQLLDYAVGWVSTWT